MKLKCLVGALALAMAITLPVAAIPVIEVTPWSAPNGFGSPSIDGAVANAIYAQRNGLLEYGDPSLPTYYQAAPANMQVQDNIVTGYNSWKGDANPVGSYGAAYASELGNRLLFGLLVKGNGSQISISQLGFSMDSTDANNSLDYAFAVGSYNYSLQYQGWLYGGDGLPNTGDDSFITSGPNTQLVDALVGRGSGNAWASYVTDPGATLQDKLDGVVADVGTDPFTFTGTYSIGGATGSGTVAFNSVPDSGSTAALLIAGVSILGVVARRRGVPIAA